MGIRVGRRAEEPQRRWRAAVAVLVLGSPGCTLQGDAREGSTHSTATRPAPSDPTAGARDGGVASSPPLTVCEAAPASSSRGTEQGGAAFPVPAAGPPEPSPQWGVALGP